MAAARRGEEADRPPTTPEGTIHRRPTEASRRLTHAPVVRSYGTSTLEPLPPPPDPSRARLWQTTAAILVVLMLALTAAVGVAAWQKARGPPQLSTYGDDWNDLSGLRKLIEDEKRYTIHDIVSSQLTLRHLETINPTIKYTNSALLIIGVERPYNDNELAAIRDYVFRGGIAVIADDYGYGNQLTFDDACFGVRRSPQERCVPTPVKDVQFEHNPKFLAFDVTGSQLGSGRANLRYHVVTNEPVTLSIPEERRPAVQVIASTSPDAWLDVNNDNVLDLTEQVGSFPLIVSRGSDAGDRHGLWWYVGDPSLFINDMIDRGDNRAFIRAFLEAVLPRGHLIIDESRHAGGQVGDSGTQLTLGAIQNLLANVWFELLSPLVIIAFVGLLYLRTPAQPRRRHRDILNDPRPVHYLRPYLMTADAARVRQAFLERVRHTAGQNKEEFYRPDTVRLWPTLISDHYLTAFALLPSPQLGAITPEVLRAYSSRAFHWVPPGERGATTAADWPSETTPSTVDAWNDREGDRWGIEAGDETPGTEPEESGVTQWEET